jgi:uncharacterized phage protein gp47/JayE
VINISYFSPFIDSSGLHIPSYADILADLLAQAQAIFGTDIYLGNDSQDYQYTSIIALKISDAFQLVQMVYNNCAPGTAIGVGQDLLYKCNGLVRNAATYSTCPVSLIGAPGTSLSNSWVQDKNGYQWSIPATILGSGGTAQALATCSYPGPISAAPGDISIIVTPTMGWYSVMNAGAATLGVNTEADSAFRARQAFSTAQPSLSILDGLRGAIAGISGVTRSRVYENDTGSPDGNSQPAHSIAAVVEGGDSAIIANTVFSKKGPGGATVGTTTINVTDQWQEITAINFYRPTYDDIDVVVGIKQLTGYTTAIAANIKAAIVSYLNSLQIGDDLSVSSLWGAALSVQELTRPVFSITALTACLHGGSPGTSDIVTAYNEVVRGNLGYIKITPMISSISPATGTHTGGTAVAITGVGFTGVTSVKFGSASATSVVVVSDTQITCVSPAVSAGTVDITAINAAGTSPTSSADQFIYT